mmetsp:Transcript_25039/g.35967  ORF Transcript_25039/g.35967 Transcript_25039/m.35967 type:complete len:457 (-) Transcript_25039:3399-4769(-)
MQGLLWWLLYSGSHSAFIALQRKKRQKRLELKRKCLRFLLDGYILVDSINPSSKKRAWIYSILPQLCNHWLKVHSDKFNIQDSTSWPCPINGVSYESNLTAADQIQYPKLLSSNNEIQSIIIYLFDDDDKSSSVRFDFKSSWFVQSVVSNLKTLFGSLWASQENLILLSGNNHGWNLINWKQSIFPAGQPIPNKAHIDGGEAFHYKQGLPINASTAMAIYDMKRTETGCDVNLQARLSILSMLMWQISIIFYCDTPGDLTIEEGVTGFYRGSHFPILHSLHRYMHTYFSTLSNSTDDNIPSVIDYTTFAAAIKQFGVFTQTDRLQQHEIPDGKALLCFGPVAHTLMWSTKAMCNNLMPRSMQNAKILGDRSKLSSTHSLLELVNKIKPQSLIGRLADDPEAFLSYATKELNDMKHEEDGYMSFHDSDRDISHELEILKRDSDFLYERFRKSSNTIT